MKTITGKVHRKEGKERERLYTEITCSECGAKTYERKKDKIEQALKRECNSCRGIAARERDTQRKLQFDQDTALLTSLRSIHKLIRKPDKRIKHGCCSLCRRTLNIYSKMLRRCYNTNTAGYEHYGGRGITVCDRWQESVQNFFQDMGAAPEGYSLERVDVNGNYEPGNCKWIPKGEQSKNRRCSLVNRGIDDPVEYWRGYRKVRHRQNYVPTGRPRGRPRKTQKK